MARVRQPHGVRSPVTAIGRLAAALTATLVCAIGPPGSHLAGQRAAAPFEVAEASIPQMRTALEQGRTTSRALTEQYLARLSRHGARLHATLSINPQALAEADARDRERRLRRVRGALHGIPIALKDNIHADGMPTTGGALAFARLRPPYEATLTKNLRAAGAVIIAKTTLTELANWVSSSMPSGYNAIAGASLNPYDASGAGVRGLLDPGGSSSGIGTAASLWAASVGTETSGSILNPANQTLLVGIKPTVGRISRHGVIPITADQDTPGPLARSVTDAAILLGALESAMPDPQDPATRTCRPPPGRDYTRFLRRDGLRGARIGVPRAALYDRRRPGPGPDSRSVVESAIGVLKTAGATVIDPADLPSLMAADPSSNVARWSICVGRRPGRELPNDCSIVFQYGMKRDFNRWLASLGAAAPLRTLGELRAWNREHVAEGAIQYGQDQLDGSDAIDLGADRARYEADRAKDLRLSRDEGIDAAIRAHSLDALLFPGFFASPIAAKAGYPTVIVPFSPPSTLPTGAVTDPLGISFTGPLCAEPRLIEIAYGFEQATRRRVPPRLD